MFILLYSPTCCLQAFAAVVCDDLDDFPLDDGSTVDDNVTDNADDSSADTATTVDGEHNNMADLDMDDEPLDEST